MRSFCQTLALYLYISERFSTSYSAQFLRVGDNISSGMYHNQCDVVTFQDPQYRLVEFLTT